MKIETTTTVIECSAEELRQSNTLADAFSNIFRKTLNGNTYFPNDISEDESEE